MEKLAAVEKEVIPPYFTLDLLDMKRNDWRIVVRLLRTWEARNLKQNRELMSLDFLLLDEKGSVIQASIHHRRVEKFKELLKEGKIFKICNFEVIQNKNRYRMTDHQYMIRFMDHTSMEEVGEEVCCILREKFQIRSYDELVELANKNEELPDIIGQIHTVKKPDCKSEAISKKATIKIIMQGGAVVRVTVWDELADDVCGKLAQMTDKSIVMIVTGVNPRTYGGELYLNTTTSSKLYLNGDYTIVRDFLERNVIQHHSIETCENNDTILATQKAQTIAELASFTSEEKEQEKIFWCKAKVIDVLLHNGWNYVSCAKCSKKLTKSESKLACEKCSNIQAVGVLRFRIEAVVADGQDTATFVIFDREAKRIMNTSAADIMTSKDIDNKEVDKSHTIPKCIQGIVGRTFLFQVKLTPFNFRSRSHGYTVSRILDANDDMPSDETKTMNSPSTCSEPPNRSTSGVHEIGVEVNKHEDSTGVEKTKKRRMDRKHKNQVIVDDAEI